MKKYIAALLAVGIASARAASNAVATAPATNAVRKTTATAAGTSTFWTQYGTLIITVVVIGVVFAFLWSKGYLVKIRNYIEETQEELKKCTWPSIDELKGSTVVVMLTIAILGAFTVGVDWILSMVVRLITA